MASSELDTTNKNDNDKLSKESKNSEDLKDIINQSSKKETVINQSFKKETITDKLGKLQKDISVTEFFQKNKQVLGFENPSKSLMVVLRQAVDNCLDACDAAGIVPQIFIKIEKIKNEKKQYSIEIQDNGPGINYDKVPKIFGKLLHGSKFFSTAQSRGALGIGISAVNMFGQLTTGTNMEITSKIQELQAMYFKIGINIEKNEPLVLDKRVATTSFDRGINLKVFIECVYTNSGKHGVPQYLKLVHLMNPNLTIHFTPPKEFGEPYSLTRVIDYLLPVGIEVLPNPQSLELGPFKSQLNNHQGDLENFLDTKISKIDDKSKEFILTKVGTPRYTLTSDFSLGRVKRIFELIKQVTFIPSEESLSMLNTENLYKAIKSNAPYTVVITAQSGVGSFNGHSFKVQGGLIYDPEGVKEEKVELIRVTNKVPLLYCARACLLTDCLVNYNWKNHGVSHTSGEFPHGSFKILLHLASGKIAYLGENKESVADIIDYKVEINQVLKKLGLGLNKHLAKEKLRKKKEEKEKIINNLFPTLVRVLTNTIGKPPPNIEGVISKIVDSLYLIFSDEDNSTLVIKAVNYSKKKYNLDINYYSSPESEVSKCIFIQDNSKAYITLEGYDRKSRIIITDKNMYEYFTKVTDGCKVVL